MFTRLAATRTRVNSSQGTSEAWHPRTMNSCYNDKFFHDKWGGSGRPSRPASDGPDDKLYICDNGNNRFQVLNTELEYMHSFGYYGRGCGEFKWPNDIAQDGAGNLYVSDTLNNRVQVFNSEGQFLFEFFERGADSELCRPFGICVDSDQFVYVCDSWN